MKLLYVCSDFGITPTGTKGASIHLRAITRALSDLGHRVDLLSPHPGPGGDHPAYSLLATDLAGPPAASGDLRRWLKGHGLPHSVAGEMRSLLYNDWAVPRALGVLEQDPPDAIVERLSLMSHVGLDLSRDLKCPLLVEVNALLSREAKQFRQLEMVSLAERIEHRVLQRADAVMVVSKQLGASLADFGVAPSKIHVIPNGAEIEAFDPEDDGHLIRDALQLGEAFVVGFVGSLKIWHGVDVLISGFKMLHDRDAGAKLLIVGTGPTEQSLREQADEMGLGESVVFTGAVDHADIPKHLSAMDVTTAPFRTVDAFYFSPIKLFEYMAAGRCVVASQLGQIEDVIADGENGVLCRPDDAESLADALITLWSDPDLRRRMASMARDCAERDYTWRMAATTTSDLIAECCGQPSAVGHQL